MHRMKRLVVVSAALLLLAAAAQTAPPGSSEVRLIEIPSTQHYIEEPLVKLKSGQVKGLWFESRDGRHFAGFTNIPYAKAPVRDLRFKAPRPAEPWRGILRSVPLEEIPFCPAYLYPTTDYIVKEDCLKINVFTPSINHEKAHAGLSDVIDSRNKFPVIVWIPGSQNDEPNPYQLIRPNYFLDKDVIFVTFNSRVGILGFLSTGDGAALGNWGLKDQTFALKWVKENIHKFGGDPDLVTIVGHGVGGQYVQYHMRSELSKGLFHRAISQSVEDVMPGHTIQVPYNPLNLPFGIEPALKVGKQLKCKISSSEELLTCIRSKNLTDILFAAEQGFLWEAVIENLTRSQLSEDIFFDLHDMHDFTDPHFSSDVPFLTGTNSASGAEAAYLLIRAFRAVDTIFSFQNFVPDLRESTRGKNLLELLSILYEYKETSPDPDMVSEQLAEFYHLPYDLRKLTANDINNIFSDSEVALLDRILRIYGERIHSPIYMYYFNYRGYYSTLNQYADDRDDPDYIPGASFHDDMIYLFPAKLSAMGNHPITLHGTDLAVSQLLIDLWANFARTGNPTPSQSNVHRQTHPPLWLPAGTDKHLYYAEISPHGQLDIGIGLRSASVQFWKTLPLTGKSPRRLPINQKPTTPHPYPTHPHTPPQYTPHKHTPRPPTPGYPPKHYTPSKPPSWSTPGYPPPTGSTPSRPPHHSTPRTPPTGSTPPRPPHTTTPRTPPTGSTPSRPPPYTTPGIPPTGSTPSRPPHSSTPGTPPTGSTPSRPPPYTTPGIPPTGSTPSRPPPSSTPGTPPTGSTPSRPPPYTTPGIPPTGSTPSRPPHSSTPGTPPTGSTPSRPPPYTTPETPPTLSTPSRPPHHSTPGTPPRPPYSTTPGHPPPSAPSTPPYSSTPGYPHIPHSTPKYSHPPVPFYHSRQRRDIDPRRPPSTSLNLMRLIRQVIQAVAGPGAGSGASPVPLLPQTADELLKIINGKAA